MKIDLTALFSGSKKQIDIDSTVDMSELIYSSYTPIKNGVSVKGRLYTKADVIYFDVVIGFMFDGFCDRCACDVKREFSFNVKRIVVEQLQNEDNDEDYIVVCGRELDIDSLVREEVALSLPSKILCSDDCKGICPQCGANLNVSKCDCKSEIDPRMAKLLELLDEE